MGRRGVERPDWGAPQGALRRWHVLRRSLSSHQKPGPCCTQVPTELGSLRWSDSPGSCPGPTLGHSCPTVCHLGSVTGASSPRSPEPALLSALLRLGSPLFSLYQPGGPVAGFSPARCRLNEANDIGTTESCQAHSASRLTESCQMVESRTWIDSRERAQTRP